jgi:transposase
MEFYYVCRKRKGIKEGEVMREVIGKIGEDVMGELERYKNRSVVEREIGKYVEK